MKHKIIGEVSLEALKEIIEILEIQETHKELNKSTNFLGLESEFIAKYDNHGNAKIYITKIYED